MRRAPCRSPIPTGTSGCSTPTATRRRSSRDACHPCGRRCVASEDAPEDTMGLVVAMLVLRNPRLPRIAPAKVDALADTGAVHLCIPEHVREQLKLEIIDQKV